MNRISVRVVGGVVAIVAALQWVILEAISASAWSNPAYSYVLNYISDLGTTVCGGDFQGRVLCSPLNAVMNTSFVTQGVLFAVAAVLLSRLLVGHGRVVVIVLGLLHGIGMTLVGLFHGESGGPSVGLLLHVSGAGVAILAANALAIFVGIRAGAIGAPRWFRIVSVALGAGGIVSELLLSMFPSIAGALERGGVYSFLLWEALAGVLAIVAITAESRRPKPENRLLLARQ